MRVRIDKGIARGKLTAPTSKSMAHRLLICAAMAEGVSVVRQVNMCDDVLATLDSLGSVGVRYEIADKDITLWGINLRNAVPTQPLDCRESGSTLRFLIPPMMLTGKPTILTGKDGLMRRPMKIYEDMAKQKGICYNAENNMITVCGPLPSGEYTVMGNVSSQFISGLLFALPQLSSDSILHLIPPVESRSYIDMTLEALALFGVKVEWQDSLTLKIHKNQKYIPADVTVEGDYSGAAFLHALNYLGGEVELLGLEADSLQGDRVYNDYFSALDKGFCSLDITDCPDLAPILFVMACAKHGAVFNGTRRLKIKESDRAEVMAQELRKFGADITVLDNSVIINKAPLHAPSCAILAHNDHRIVMSLSILLTRFGGEICGAEAIRKSYGEFFTHLRSLGIGVTEYDV